jgi:hypothetical protein
MTLALIDRSTPLTPLYPNTLRYRDRLYGSHPPECLPELPNGRQGRAGIQSRTRDQYRLLQSRLPARPTGSSGRERVIRAGHPPDCSLILKNIQRTFVYLPFGAHTMHKNNIN